MKSTWPWHFSTTPLGVEVDVDHNAGSVVGATVGTIQGGHGGDHHVVVVNIAQQLDNPPDTMREYLKSLWKNQLTYQRDQYVYRQQRHADERRREQTLRRYQRCVTRWLIGLTVVVSLLVTIMVIWIVQWTARFGWLW